MEVLSGAILMAIVSLWFLSLLQLIWVPLVARVRRARAFVWFLRTLLWVALLDVASLFLTANDFVAYCCSAPGDEVVGAWMFVAIGLQILAFVPTWVVLITP